jgi:peptidoglycan/LPS O-acetylase OafA/YrhL
MDALEMVELARARAAKRATDARWPAWMYGLASAGHAVLVLLIFEVITGTEDGRFRLAQAITVCASFLVVFGVVTLINREFHQAFTEELDRLKRENN